MGNLQFYAPVIFVTDINRSKEFYMSFFDQEIEHDFGKNIMFSSRLSLWETSEHEEIKSLHKPNTSCNNFELYFETDAIDTLAERMRSNNIRLLHDIKTEAWGQKTIRIFDPDNHLLEIGESFNTFICRIYKETNSITQTAKQTGVKENIIEKIVKS